LEDQLARKGEVAKCCRRTIALVRIGLFTLFPTDLIVIEGDQNTKRGGVIARVYINILREYLPTILAHNSIFMQDNALIHKAHKVQDIFIKLRVEVID
jgi:hypothetical protein